MAAFSEAAAPPGEKNAEAAGGDLRAWQQRPDPEPDFSRERRRPAARELRVQPRVGLLGFVQRGVLPALAVGGALELGMAVGRRWSFAVQGGVSAEQEHAAGEGRRSLLRLFAGTARACVAPLAVARLRLDVCSGLQLLWLRGHGDGFDVDRSASLTAAAPLLSFDVSVKAPEVLEWRAELEGSLPLSRQRFLVDGGQAARADAVTFAARVGPVVRF
jgi:hypothetical protein